MLVFAKRTSKQLTILYVIAVGSLRKAFSCVKYVFCHIVCC